jgi:hypothetical protein
MSLLVLHCGGPFVRTRLSKLRKCQNSMQVPFGISRDDLTASIGAHGWIVSMVTTDDAPEPAFDVLCATCAKAVYGEKLYAEGLRKVKERTQKPNGGTPG